MADKRLIVSPCDNVNLYMEETVEESAGKSMKIIIVLIFWISAFIIFWAMIGYPISISVIGKLLRSRKNSKDYEMNPEVTIMVVAHNEEKVILEKLKNLLQVDYEKDRIKILVASDNSTDCTNDIVKKFVDENSDWNIKLYEVHERKGKTNAQNEAQKLVDTEFLIMTDANSMLHKEAVRELMASFTSEKIVYVTGALRIVNGNVNDISNSEQTYWDGDLRIRQIESDIKTITAGNGALYACRNSCYIDFNPIECHDSAMPIYYGIEHKRAIANHDAVAYEKAGESSEDEFARKVRMNRVLLKHILPDVRMLNVFSYGWFSYFYFGHRTCRYLLWLSHLLVLVTSGILISDSVFWGVMFWGQILFYLLAFVRKVTKVNNKLFNMCYYYTITIIAQWIGVYNILTGKAKPFWEKAESTR